MSGTAAVTRRRARRLLVGDGGGGVALGADCLQGPGSNTRQLTQRRRCLLRLIGMSKRVEQVLRRISHTPGPIQAVAHGVFEEAP